MIDREKVMKGLECCIKRNPDDNPRCGECPYDGACLNRLKIDAIELLKEQEQTPGEWVSVKDRLPDAAGYECLVCAVNTNYNQTHVFTAYTGYGEPGWWTGNVHYMSKGTSPYDNRLHPALKVTHWMLLPEPPEGGETNAAD